MNTEYEDGHPLYGQTAEWIAARAKCLSDLQTEPHEIMLNQENFAALAHEYRRLKAKFNGSSAIDISLLNEKAKNRIKWLEDEVDNLKAANETKREAIINRNELIAELKSTHPPEDWLTRAIEVSGAPEGTDWAGLLEHVDILYRRENATHLNMRDWKSKANQALAQLKTRSDARTILDECAFALGMKSGDQMAHIPRETRKLRQELDEAKSSNRLMEALATDIDAEIPGPANWWGEDGTVIRARKLRKRAESAEQRKEAVESDSADLYRWIECLLRTAEIADEGQPTPCGYEWPDPELGGLHALAVPYRVIRQLAEERDRLKRDKKNWEDRATRSNEMLRRIYKALPDELKDTWDDDRLDGEVRKLRERAEAADQNLRDVEDALGNMPGMPASGLAGLAESVCKNVRHAELRAETAEAKSFTIGMERDRDRSVLKDRIAELEAKLEMTEATAAQLGLGPLRPATPTQTDLSRIAAAQERIAVAHENMVEIKSSTVEFSMLFLECGHMLVDPTEDAATDGCIWCKRAGRNA